MAQVNDIGIDLGTSHVYIMARNKGIVLNEPAVVAVERDSRKILTFGSDAFRMMGRTPGTISAIRPLRNGSVSDFQLVSDMLRQYVAHVVGHHFFARPRAVLCVPSGMNDIEKRQLMSVMFDAGIRKTQMIDRPIAAALGAGLHFTDPYGCMIIDMGAGMTDIAVLSLGEVVVSSSVQVGGDYFDDAIVRYLRKKDNLLVGDRTAEEIKISIGSAYKTADNEKRTMEVTGRNLVSGLPQTLTVTADEVYEALQEPVADLIECIQAVIEHTPPQLASDVFEDGIVLTGGACRLSGLPEAIYSALGIPCGPADEPQNCVVQGCTNALEDSREMRQLLGDGSTKWNR